MSNANWLDRHKAGLARGPYRTENWPERWYAMTGNRPNVVKVRTKRSGTQYSHTWRFQHD